MALSYENCKPLDQTTAKPVPKFRKGYIVAAGIALVAIFGSFDQLTKTAVVAEAEPVESVQAKPSAEHLETLKLLEDGWFEVQNGIYARWCGGRECQKVPCVGADRCKPTEVWAKDRAAGDIYARGNFVRDGVVTGWTNDTLYLGEGQRGILRFNIFQDYDSFELTHFNARG